MQTSFDEIIKTFDYNKYDTKLKQIKRKRTKSNIINGILLLSIISVLFLIVSLPKHIIAWIIIIVLFFLIFFIYRKFVVTEEFDEKEFRNSVLMDFLKHLDNNIQFFNKNEELENIFIDSCAIDEVNSDKISSSDCIETSMNGKHFAIGKIFAWIGSTHDVTTSFNGIFALTELSDKHQRILLLPKTKLYKNELKASEIKYTNTTFYRQKNEDTEKYSVWSENKLLENKILNSKTIEFLDNIDEQRKIGFSLYDNKLCLADYELYSSIFPLEIYNDLSEYFFREIYDSYIFYYTLINLMSKMINSKYET